VRRCSRSCGPWEGDYDAICEGARPLPPFLAVVSSSSSFHGRFNPLLLAKDSNERPRRSMAREMH